MTSPEYRLEVIQDASGGYAPRLALTNKSDNEAYSPAIVFRLGATPSAKFVLGVHDSDEDKFKISAGNVFGTDDRLVIDANGKVGIGTASPSSILNVVGDVEIGIANAFYLGDPNTDGSWAILRSGSDLLFKRRISGAWVTKSTIAG